jgi:CRP/FNR family transcriptional regulator
MPTSCHTCPLRASDATCEMSAEEVRFMEQFKTGELRVDPGTTLLLEDSSAPQLYTALDGMGLRYKTTKDGERQVLNFVLPGDFIGLQAGIMGEMTHSVEATTAMTLCVFRRRDVWKLFQTQPERAFDITWLAASEERFLGEALATIGQRPAIARVAWALMQLFRRLSALNLAKEDMTVPLPYRQQDLADALGLSLVHTNKTLKALRERQLVTWSDGHLRITNIAGLAALADVPATPSPPRPLI